ncbi:MAG: GNAT family N-acetyltransferase [bacterium]|nr:GNAT family N-acetyltransferase [bacterium]
MSERDQHFRSRFSWEGENSHPYWAIRNGDRVGFTMFAIAEDRAFAQVHDFFIPEQHRRKGIGSIVASELIPAGATEGS